MALHAEALSPRAMAIFGGLNGPDIARIVGPESVRRLPPFVQRTTSRKSHRSVERSGQDRQGPLIPDLASGGISAIARLRAPRSPRSPTSWGRDPD